MSEHEPAHTSTESTNNADLIREASAEIAEPTHYEALSSELVDLASNRNLMQRDQLMLEFLSYVRDDVLAGNVKNTKGETYTTAELDQSLNLMFQSLTKPVEGVDPLSIILSSNGLRSGVETLLRNEVTAQPLMNALQERSVGIMDPERREGDTITEIGAVAVKSAASVEPSSESEKNPLKALTEGLGVDDLLSLRAYANSMQDRRSIHSDSSKGMYVVPGASQQAAQYADAYLKEMSPDARVVARQYDLLYNKN